MMRALLLLSLVGAAIYGFLVVTEDALTDKLKRRLSYPNSAQSFSGRTTELVGLLPTQPVTKPKSATSDLSTAGCVAVSGE